MILMGDFNILEPGHQPAVHHFQHWEYVYCQLNKFLSDGFRETKKNQIEHSWVSFDGNGQRLDHVLLSPSLIDSINNCEYDHQPRIEKLSDHSLLSLYLRTAIT